MKSRDLDRIITHAVVVKPGRAFVLGGVAGWRNYRLGVNGEVPVFPVATLAELVEHEGDVVNVSDVSPFTIMSPRYLSGHKLIPMNAEDKVQRIAAGQAPDSYVPEADELSLYTNPQLDEVVPNAARALFLSLEYIRHESTNAFAFDRVTGEMEQIGKLRLLHLVEDSGMVAIALPEPLRMSFSDFNILDKKQELHALMDEPTPYFRRHKEKTVSAAGEQSFDLWDAQLGELLDAVESAMAANRQPYSGTARLMMAGWDAGHPTMELMERVMLDREKLASSETVKNHVNKCVVCANLLLSLLLDREQ